MNISKKVIGCALTVHSSLGNGFYESVYQNALALELKISGLQFTCQTPINVIYKKQLVGQFFTDFIVEDCLILELKALSRFERLHEAQLINYLAASKLPVGLLFNFGNRSLQVKRLVYRLNQKTLI